MPSLLLLLLLGLLTPLAGCARSAARISPQRFADEVSWLADDARQGRQTGSPELEQAADWIAQRFAAAGLEPGGEHGWLEPFEAAGGRILLDGNELVVAGDRLALHTDWVPFSSSASGEAEGPLVFAGYGISDPEHGYDDYDGLDVDGKIVVVLRRGPGASYVAEDAETEEQAPEFAPDDVRVYYLRGEGQNAILFATKINAAFQHGAAGLIVINDPASTPPGGGDDALVPYRSAGGPPSASLPAANLTAAAGTDLLSRLGFDLSALQQSIDERGAPRSFPLPDAVASLKVVAEREMVPTANVVGLLPGSDPELADQWVVVGAHMDHLGLGDHSGSLGGAAAVGRIHNGADDNASGTAGLIEVARALGARRDELRRTVYFVAFSAEEWGLLGSRAFVEDPPRPLDDLVAMVNMDMIGRSDDGRLIVEGTTSSPVFPELLHEVAEEVAPGLKVATPPGLSPNSDHASFSNAKVPVFNFFTGLHKDYHRPSDDADKIDAAHGALIASLAAEVTRRLARLDERPPFVQPERTRPEQIAKADGTDPHEGGETAGPRVSFGSMPDYGYEKEDGCRLTGVREGSPAETCGLQGGDLIVALDGKPVRNVEDYAVLLFAHKPGDEITVTIRRGDQTLELTAVLVGRSGDA